MRTKNMDMQDKILKLSEIYDGNVPRSEAPEPRTRESGKLTPRQNQQLMAYLTRPKSSKETLRESFKKVSDPKVPPKLAKSKEDIEEEFRVFEIPMIMREYENFIKNNPGKSFRDFLKDQKLIDAESKKRFDESVLSGALAKIDSRMSGIMSMAMGGVIKDPTYTYYSDGGKTSKPKDPTPKVRKLNLADYFKYGMTIAELSPYEREVVNDLLKKTFSKSSTDN
tara:strand:- start:255 stop:926 length:672 start_codon:yes stop_codon:yes gene_type:complete